MERTRKEHRESPRRTIGEMDWGLLAPLDETTRRGVLSAARRRRFDKGEVIFHEGDPADTMHLLAKGRVAIRVTTPLGDIATLQVVGPGAHFGELALVSPAPRNATVVALERVETLSLHRDHLDELRQQHRDVDRFLLEAAITEVRRLSHELLDALYVSVEKRVLRRLLDLAEIYRDDGKEVVIPLTQEDVAQMAGTTRPTANKILRTEEDAGTLRMSRGRIEILDVPAIERHAR